MSNTLYFTADELDVLGRTADALTAYMGKPVIAEVIDGEETGFEWVIFAIPLDVSDEPDGIVHVQVGGKATRLLGNSGGLALDQGEVYDCQFLWAIQLSDLPGVRYIKVDDEGDEVGWSDSLADLLPFDALNEPAPATDDDNEGDSDNGGDSPEAGGGGVPPTLH
ncbi:MAG: hypothetical protein AB7E12_02255 [Burkholderiaceae bacterium]